MKRVIIIRFGEIFLKGNNRGFFERLLIDNIKNILSDYSYKFVNCRCRYFIEDYPLELETVILSDLKRVSGIHSLSVATKVDTSIENIQKCVSEMFPFTGTFRVNTNRADKTFPMNSMDISRAIGGYILENNECTVDLHEPNRIVHIDVRESGKSYIFSDIIQCSSGMPCGASGNGLLLLSGGIDSPVAGYMMIHRGMHIDAVHFHSFPYTNELALAKVEKLASRLGKYCAKLTLYNVKVTEIQEAIHENCHENMMITILRRFMMRIAENIAQKQKLDCLITGESLGQVASQTIESMTCTGGVVTLPILRPLIAFDKQDIINISKEISCYETSIEPHQDCCTVFLPRNPIIRPRVEEVAKEEAKLDVQTLLENAISSITIVSSEQVHAQKC